jgi:hypothetical protein
MKSRRVLLCGAAVLSSLAVSGTALGNNGGEGDGCPYWYMSEPGVIVCKWDKTSTTTTTEPVVTTTVPPETTTTVVVTTVPPTTVPPTTLPPLVIDPPVPTVPRNDATNRCIDSDGDGVGRALWTLHVCFTTPEAQLWTETVWHIMVTYGVSEAQANVMLLALLRP